MKSIAESSEQNRWVIYETEPTGPLGIGVGPFTWAAEAWRSDGNRDWWTGTGDPESASRWLAFIYSRTV